MKSFSQLLAAMNKAQAYGQQCQQQCLLLGGSLAQSALFGDAMARRKYRRLTGGFQLPVIQHS